MKPDTARPHGGTLLRRPLCTAIASLMLAGCASLSPDGGFGEVRQLTQERTGQAPAFLRISAEAASTSSSKISLTRRNGQVKSERTSGSGMRAASAGNCASGVLGMKPDDTDS